MMWVAHDKFSGRDLCLQISRPMWFPIKSILLSHMDPKSRYHDRISSNFRFHDGGFWAYLDGFWKSVLLFPVLGNHNLLSKLPKCMHVCMYVWCVFVYMYVGCVYECMYVCIPIFMYICMYVCMFVRMYVCIDVYVYMYVCYVDTNNFSPSYVSVIPVSKSMCDLTTFSPFCRHHDRNHDRNQRLKQFSCATSIKVL